VAVHYRINSNNSNNKDTTGEENHSSNSTQRAASLRQKHLAETLRLAVLCKCSALQTMNRGKKAMDAYLEARALDDDAH
jgi:hypothetical protein